MIKQKYGLVGVAMGAVLAVSGMIASSCDGGKKEKQEDVEVKIIGLDELPGIVDAHGRIGSGTSMNVMELVGDDGDTTYVEVSSAAMMGGATVGDEVQMVYSSLPEFNVAQIAINITALQHVWTQKGEDGKPQSLELDSGGRASTFGMKIDYCAWEVKDGLLLLQSPKKVGSEQAAPVDTFEIMELTNESLVLMRGEYASEFEREN